MPHPRICAACAVAAAALAVGACGDDRRDAGVQERAYSVALERASFPRLQRLAQRTALVVTLRNTGERAIPDLVVTVRGFTDRGGGADDADPTRDLWVLDRQPAGAGTAFADRWSHGRLEPGRAATLRWDVTPVVAGRHELTIAVAPALSGPARVELERRPGAARRIAVRVTDTPAQARVDPRTGGVRRRE